MSLAMPRGSCRACRGAGTIQTALPSQSENNHLGDHDSSSADCTHSFQVVVHFGSRFSHVCAHCTAIFLRRPFSSDTVKTSANGLKGRLLLQQVLTFWSNWLSAIRMKQYFLSSVAEPLLRAGHLSWPLEAFFFSVIWLCTLFTCHV